jgi:hypothetical protein
MDLSMKTPLFSIGINVAFRVNVARATVNIRHVYCPMVERRYSGLDATVGKIGPKVPVRCTIVWGAQSCPAFLIACRPSGGLLKEIGIVIMRQDPYQQT